jgi:hypothetical protein
MVAFEEFSNHLAAVVGFITPVAWIAYKLDLFKQISKWYSSKIEDTYGIVVPSLLALLFPFIFTYLTNIPEIVKIVLPIATFVLGQNIQFNKDVTQKVETWKFYIEVELSHMAFDLRQSVSRLKIEADHLYNQDIPHGRLIQIIGDWSINHLDEIQSESLLKSITPKYLPDKAINIRLKRITTLIKKYNRLLDERNNFIQTYDDSRESRLMLMSIDDKLFRAMVSFVASIGELSNIFDFKDITWEVNCLRNELYKLSKIFGLSGIIAPS